MENVTNQQNNFINNSIDKQPPSWFNIVSGLEKNLKWVIKEQKKSPYNVNTQSSYVGTAQLKTLESTPSNQVTNSCTNTA